MASSPNASASRQSVAGSHAAGEILVRFKPTASKRDICQLNRKTEGRIVQQIKQLGIYRIRLPENKSISKTINQYAGEQMVELVQPNYEYQLMAVPNDPIYGEGSQWNLQRIQLEEAWDITTGSSSTVVAVIDSGVDCAHPDLAENIWQNPGEIPDNSIDDDNNGFVDDAIGWDFVNNDNDPFDDYIDNYGIPGHGTSTAGIISAVTDNGEGVAGISWASRIMAIKCADSGGNLNDFDLSSSIVYATDNGARVICMSLGGPTTSPILASAVNYAYSKGSFMVAAVGNKTGQNEQRVYYPAGLDHVVGVAATTGTDAHAEFSIFNSSCDVAAPGESIWTTGISDTAYEYFAEDGTSTAAPHVAGVAALLLSHNPLLSPDDLESIIMVTSDDLGVYGWDSYFGYGRINAWKALNSSSCYFAEGATLGDFEEYILLMNPEDQAAYVALNYLDRFGDVKRQTVLLPSQSRRTVRVNDISPNSEVSAKNISGSRVLAERSMYFSYDGKDGGHDSIGVTSPSTEWYLAEGYTGGDFDTYVLIQNPNNQTANTTATFMKRDGTTVQRQYDIGANSRFTIYLDEILPDDEVSTKIESTNGIGVIAERSMYFDYNGKDGGHDSIGVTAPCQQWYLAEGYTGGDFDTYVLIQNPSNRTANTTVTFMKRDGETVKRHYDIGANSRFTIHVDEILPDDEVSTKIESTNGIGVIAERSMYFDYNGKDGGHDSIGVTTPSAQWYLPEGYTGDDFDTWVLVQNPEPAETQITLTFYTKSQAPIFYEFVLAGNSRETVELDQIPGLSQAEVSTKVESAQPVIAERAMYFNYHVHDGGHASIGYED